MKTPAPQFDIYPDLDRHINVAGGLDESDNLGTAVQAEIEATVLHYDQEELRPEVKDWIIPELVGAQLSWSKYTDLIDLPSVTKLAEGHHDFARTAERLYVARKKLNLPLYTLPGEPEGGTLLGESMHVVMVPWQAILQKIEEGDFGAWLQEMRRRQNLQQDIMADEVLEAIVMGNRLYQEPDLISEWVRPKYYLKEKIEEEGPWGIMLIQDSPQAGVNHGPRPKEEEEVMIGDVRVDAMGVFEWLALTLQADDPAKMGRGWLPASYVFDKDNVQLMTVGMGHHFDRVETTLAAYKLEDISDLVNRSEIEALQIRMAVA